MPKKTRTLLVLGALVLLVILGTLWVVREKFSADDPAHETTTKITQILESTGVSVDRVEETGGAFSSQKSATFFVSGEPVTAFFYRSPTEALTIAQQFSPDAQTLAGTPMEWVAPPHFYMIHNAIILYIGSSPPITEALTKAFGAQFAGS